MSKNIVVCLDGTGNQFKEDNSNVVKLFRCIIRDGGQVAYYDAGVGTLADPQFKTPVVKRISKWIGLGLGLGVLKNVEEAYSYLMENYEVGDKLFLFGFSRGAYTARVLAGLIHACGLLESGNQNQIPYAIKLYRSRKRRFWFFGNGQPPFEVMAKFKSTFSRNVDIHFLGLWDSVSTHGWIYSPLFLPFATNNPSVKAVRHALAIDERRSFFQPMPWGKKHANSQDIKEVWFAGVHSDVGGGYPESESGLAKLALHWMLMEAGQSAFGLSIKKSRYERYVLGTRKGGYVAPDATDDAHRSLKTFWWLVQFLPRSVWLVDQSTQGLRFSPKRRTIPEDAMVHSSVFDRMANTNYRPTNLAALTSNDLEANYSIVATPSETTAYSLR